MEGGVFVRSPDCGLVTSEPPLKESSVEKLETR